MQTDRFGNPWAPGLPYARGRILTSTEDEFRKLERAWSLVEERLRQQGRDGVIVLTGLEHGLPLDPGELGLADDELASALYGQRLRRVALDHLGGVPETHDVALFNRLTGATLATMLALVERGATVLGLSASRSHPSVLRAARHVGARFVDTADVDAFARALERASAARLVVLTRLAVTYDLLPLEAIRTAVKLAHDRGLPVYMDDAGGARVGPAVFGQPRLLELGVDLGATGLDKYGTMGPRLGLLGGERGLVARVRARGFECGLEARQMLYPAAVRSLEAYRPERVRALVACTQEVGAALRARFGARVHETPVTAQLRAEDILELAMERAGLTEPPVVPYEATAALSMLLLRDHGILTVHFVGVPPGTPDLLVKFVPPETLARLGGAGRLVEAIDAALAELGRLLREPGAVRALLLGEP